MKELLDKVMEESEELVKHALHELDNPALSAATCGHDYFKSLVPDASNTLNELKIAVEQRDLKPQELVRVTIQIGHRLSNFILYGKATSNTSRNILFGERK